MPSGPVKLNSLRTMFFLLYGAFVLATMGAMAAFVGPQITSEAVAAKTHWLGWIFLIIVGALFCIQGSNDLARDRRMAQKTVGGWVKAVLYGLLGAIIAGVGMYAVLLGRFA